MFLLTTDLHFTDKPQDTYRWPFIDWLKGIITTKKVSHLFILGDLTDDKDKHSAVLVNRLTSAVAGLSKRTPITIVKGNHDYVDPDKPFFGFLNYLDNVHFYRAPTTDVDINGFRFVILPHCRQPELEWKQVKLSSHDFILMHQTVGGALASNGYRLDGLSTKMFSKVSKECRIFSGDIHTPQDVGRVTYVGSPYHVHFGDSWDPRCIYIDSSGKESNLTFPCLRKHVVDVAEVEDLYDFGKINPGDQVKIRVHLSRGDYVDWGIIKKRTLDIAAELEWDVLACELKTAQKTNSGTTEKTNQSPIAQPKDVFKRYCKKEKVDSFTREVGEEILDEVQNPGDL